MQSASGANAASGSAARSSEFAATPPTTATRSKPDDSGLLQATHERSHDRALVRRCEVGLAPLRLGRIEFAHRVQERRLEPREGEVEAGDSCDREGECLGIALLREPVDRRAARIPEPEQASSLVERLARRVVERRPQPLRATALAHGEEKRVPAAREQAREGRLDRIGLEVQRGDMPLQVIDRSER